MQPIVPPVYRTGNPDLDRNFDAIAAAFRRLNLGSGDHLVIVDKSDTPDTAENKVVQGTGVTIEKTGKAGDRQLTVSADPAGIVNEITNNETLVENISNSLTESQTFVTNITNITEVNSTTPTSVATTLFPAEKPDPLNLGQVVCVFTGPHTKGTNTPMLVGWTQVSTGVLEYQFLGPLPKSWFDGVTVEPAYGKVSSLIGKTVLAYYQGDTSVTGDEEKLQGTWVVDSVGFEWQPTYGHPGTHSGVMTYPRMHRAPGFTAGTSLPVGATLQAQTGNSWGTKFFTLNTTAVIGTDPLAFTVTDTKTWADKLKLCTSPELTTEGVSLDPQTVVGTLGGSASSDTTITIGNPFVAASAFGITSIPAEPFQIDIASVYVAGLNYDSVLTVEAQLWEVTPDGVSEVGAMIASGECTPLSNGTTTSIAFHATPSAVRSVSPTDKLMLLWTLHLKATSTQATITVRISYGAPWGTKITVPWQMSVTGVASGDHQQLSRRDQDVASADAVKADPCHPYEALGPAGRHFHRVAAGTMVGTILTFPDDASSCAVTLAANLTLDGIDATGFLPTDTSVECPVSIIFVTNGHTLTVRSGQSVSSPAEPIQLVTASGVPKNWGGTRRCRLGLVHNSAAHTWDETSRSIY